MSRTLRTAAVWSLALATVIASSNASIARACGHRPSYRSYYRPRIVTRVVARPVAVVAPVAVRPVRPAPPLPPVPAGSTLTLPGNFLGTAPGQVFLVFSNVKLPAQLVNWKPNGVTITLPPMAVRQPTPARLDVVLPQGQITNAVKILLTPPAAVVLHPTAPAAPLPAAPGMPAPAAGSLPTAAAAPQIGSPVVQAGAL